MSEYRGLITDEDETYFQELSDDPVDLWDHMVQWLYEWQEECADHLPTSQYDRITDQISQVEGPGPEEGVFTVYGMRVEVEKING